jgi:hypothetical protein
MGLAFSTAGRIAFRVTVRPTSVGLGRFAAAVFRTEARVSHAIRISTTEYRAVVWLKVASVPLFESLCRPESFDFIATKDLIRGNLDEPTDEGEP